MDNLDIADALKMRPKGRYKEVCKIPKDFLNVGIYKIEVVICTNPTTENYIAVADSISFEIIDDKTLHDDIRGDWVREWPNYPVRPRFYWVVEKMLMQENRDGNG
jgi:hypothetical protein